MATLWTLAQWAEHILAAIGVVALALVWLVCSFNRALKAMDEDRG